MNPHVLYFSKQLSHLLCNLQGTVLELLKAQKKTKNNIPTKA